MAICIPKAAGGKWSVTTTWEEGKVPTAEDDVIFEATSGNVEISAVAVCRSFDALSYKGVLTNKSTLTIGTTTSAANKVALRLSASMTWTNGTGSGVTFKSTVGTALIILQAGHGLSQMVISEGKYELSGALVAIGSFQINAKAELKSNSAEIKVPTFAASEKVILSLGTSKIFITETIGAVLTIGAEVTITGTATWEVNGASTSNKKVSLNGRTLTTLTIAADAVEFTTAATIENLAMNTAGKVTGTKVAKGITLTVVTSFTGNGKAGSLVRIISNEGGKSFTFSKTSGVVALDFLELVDSHATGGALWYAGANSLNISGNEGWKFEARPLREHPSVVSVGTTSAATATGTAAKVVAPAGILDKDVVVVKLAVESGSEAEPVITPPAGFELIGRRKIGSPRNEVYYWFRYVGGGATTWEFTFTSLEFSWSCSMYRGCIPTGLPYENATFSSGSVTTANITHPGITISNHAEVIYIGASDEHGFTINALAGYNTRVSTLDELVVDKQSTATGATGEVALVMNGSNAGGVNYAILMLGLLPYTPLGQSQSVSFTRTVTRGLSIAQAQAAEISLTKPPTPIALSVTQAQVAKASVVVARALVLSQGQNRTVVLTVQRGINCAVSQTVASAKALARTMPVGQGQSATSADAVTHALSSSAGQSPSCADAVAKALSSSSSQTTSAVLAVARKLTSAQAQSVLAVLTPTRSLALSGSQAATAGTAVGIGFSMMQAQSPSATAALTHALASGQAQTVASALAVARALGAAQGQEASSEHSSTVTFAVAQPQAVVLALALARGLAASGGQSATSSIAAGVALEAAQGSVATTAEVSSVVLAVVQKQVLAVVLAVACSLSAEQGSAATSSHGGAFAITLSIEQAVSTSVGPKLARTLSRSQEQAVTRSAEVARSLRASQSSIPGPAITVLRTLVRTQNTSVSVLEGRAFFATLASSQSQSASARRVPNLRMAASCTSATSVGAAVARMVKAAQGSAPSFSRALTRSLNATQTSACRMVRLSAHLPTASSASEATIALRVARALNSSSTQSVSVEIVGHEDLLPPLQLSSSVASPTKATSVLSEPSASSTATARVESSVELEVIEIADVEAAT